MRACPHCSGEIQDEAVFCRHCRRDVELALWLTAMRRCPYCAEWIDLEVAQCPHCQKQLHVGRPERTAPFVESSLDQLVGGLREEGSWGQGPPDNLGRGWDTEAQAGRDRGGGRAGADRSAPARESPPEARRGLGLLRRGRAAEPEGGRARGLLGSGEDAAPGPGWQRGRKREAAAPGGDRGSRRGAEAWPSRGDDRGHARQAPQPATSDSEPRRSWEADLEQQAAALESKDSGSKPRVRKFGPFRIGRGEPKPEAEPGPGRAEPLFGGTYGEEPARPLESYPSSLPSARRRETSSFPSADREALLEDGLAQPGRGRRLLAALVRTMIGLTLLGAVAFGGFYLVRGPGAPLLAGLLATEAPPSPTPTPAPTSTLSRAPTLPPETASVVEGTPATPGPTGCVSWEQVTLADEGKELCVFGVIRRWFAVDEVPFVAIFSEEAGTFALIDRTGVHPMGPGDCVQGTGVVEVMRGTRPNIDVRGELEPCSTG